MPSNLQIFFKWCKSFTATICKVELYIYIHLHKPPTHPSASSSSSSILISSPTFLSAMVRMAKGKCVISVQHVVIGVMSMVLLIQTGEATTFAVGGTKGWTVPSDNSPVYNQWAHKMRFQIGDSLLFVYRPIDDSVLRVKKEDFDSCNTNSPSEKYTDGHTEIKFNQSGPYYFISGNRDYCLKNEKLVVVVLADRTKKTSSSTPSPAPATASPPSPDSSDGGAAAPSSESLPPNRSAGSMFAMSFVGSLGAFLGSSLLLLAF